MHCMSYITSWLTVTTPGKNIYMHMPAEEIDTEESMLTGEWHAPMGHSSWFLMCQIYVRGHLYIHHQLSFVQICIRWLSISSNRRRTEYYPIRVFLKWHFCHCQLINARAIGYICCSHTWSEGSFSVKAAISLCCSSRHCCFLYSSFCGDKYQTCTTDMHW